jgi:hypothetical protein
LQKLITGIKTNFSLVLKGVISGLLLIVGPLIAVLIRLGGANMGNIITWGLIFEVIGLAGFWFIIRKEYFIGEEREDRKTPFKKIQARLSKSEDSDN